MVYRIISLDLQRDALVRRQREQAVVVHDAVNTNAK